jgi:hypothetical protein
MHFGPKMSWPFMGQVPEKIQGYQECFADISTKKKISST